MFFPNFYFFNGTAYAGKSTMVRMLAEKHNGVACGENYHNAYLDQLDSAEYPCLTYTRDLQDWHDFIRRTPDEYEKWIDGASRESEKLELRILSELEHDGRPVFVDTNISIETLRVIADPGHVMIMLAEPDISVKRFFDRPDRDKQFLYRLILEEPDPEYALQNFRQCLERINTQRRYDRFKSAGFPVIVRDESRTPEETMKMVEELLGIEG